MVARSRCLPAWLLAVLLVGGLCLVPGHEMRAQNNSLFPKGGPNRKLPQATPLPRGAASSSSAASSSAASATSRRRQPAPPRPDTVALPYNLVWFDSQNRLASLFAGVNAKVTEKRPESPNEIWTVKELIAPNLRTSFFTFQQGMLIGLEFDYGQDSWDTDKYNEVMGQFRRLLETKCEAPGEIISRKSEQVPNSTIKETLMGYQWVRGDTAVQLFYYSAEDTAKALTFRSISVHYRFRDPNAPPPGSESSSPAPAPQPAPGGNNNQTVTVTPAGPDNVPGGTLPVPDPVDNSGGNNNTAMPPAGTPPSSSPKPAATPFITPDGELPGPEPVETAPDGDTAAAMAPAPSPSPTPNASPAATPTPTPSPTPKKSSGRSRRR